MAINHFTEEILTEEESATVQDLRESFQSQEEKNRLKITGLEPIILFLATKVVVPIVSGFVSRALYNQYKDIQTESKAREAKKRLVTTVVKSGEEVDEKVMQVELAAILTQEGIPEELARRVIDRTIYRVKSRITGASDQGTRKPEK